MFGGFVVCGVFCLLFVLLPFFFKSQTSRLPNIYLPWSNQTLCSITSNWLELFCVSANSDYPPVLLSEETASWELPSGTLKPESISAFFRRYESTCFPYIRIIRGIFFYQNTCHKQKALRNTTLMSENPALKQVFLCLSKTISSSVFAIIRRRKSAKVVQLYYRNFLKSVSVITYPQIEEIKWQIVEVEGINFRINIFLVRSFKYSSQWKDLRNNFLRLRICATLRPEHSHSY